MRTPRVLASLLLLITAVVGFAAAPGASASSTYADWYTYHGSNYRTGLATTMPPVSGPMRLGGRVTLDGQVYASPLIIGGKIVVATENNTVYEFDSSYHLVWRKHLGPPSPASQRPCGNIDPLGITGTPTYDPSTGLIFVAAEISGNPPTHTLYALSLRTGVINFTPIALDLPGVDSRVMQERGALAVHGGRVYVPFGGLAGDCGAYKGRVVSHATNVHGYRTVYTVPTSREAGIWTPPGPTIDNAGHILVAVGNGASGPGDRYDHSDSVLSLTTGLKLADSFSPSGWAQENAADADLGSQGPAITRAFVFQAGKSGYAYTLHRTHLGGIGGQVQRISLCRSFGGTAVDDDVVIVPCEDGLRAVRVDSTGHMHVLWHAASSITGSPVIGGGRIFSLDTSRGILYALDPSTGSARSSYSVGAVSRFASPAIFGRRVFVPTLAGFTAVTTS